MLFGMWTLGGPVNHVLGGHLHPPMGRGAFGGTLAVDILNGARGQHLAMWPLTTVNITACSSMVTMYCTTTTTTTTTTPV